MQAVAGRFAGRNEGCFNRRASLDEDVRPGELSRAVARAKAGDREAMRYLYVRFADNVYGYARSIVRDEHEAEDVTQQVFARLLTALKRYEERAVPFSAWLLRIAHNTAIDHMRRRTIACEDVRAVDERCDEHNYGLSLALREALSELPEGQREVVVLRQVAGWAPGEIAAQLGRSEDSVHGLHHRGRRALRKALAHHGAVPAVARG
ncbi:MAG: hypothetical protein QOJ97_1373 [Solirubrobacteraceae bacterium]|jgi:RNA polymerase sigma-70 factor (ECF subfamily)|nr:hypothetical protein [Solirubrobacteraceae bacterium]